MQIYPLPLPIIGSDEVVLRVRGIRTTAAGGTRRTRARCCHGTTNTFSCSVPHFETGFILDSHMIQSGWTASSDDVEGPSAKNGPVVSFI